MSKLDTDFIPASKRDSRRLLVALHGLGDSTAGYTWMPLALQLDWMNYLLVNAPDPYFGGFSWYDFADNPRPGVERSRELLFDLLDTQQSRGFPSQETILFGFSQGCLMVVDVGFRYPRRLAGLVGVSGYVFEPEQLLEELSPAAKEQKMLFTHGTQDPLIPFAAAREQVDSLRARGLAIEWREFVKAHTIAGETELTLIRNFILGCYAGC